MKHLGDITQISGKRVEPVDCITFGSPCQDLSIAGKRAGLAGERSGLFMEAVRIIKEMRSATNGVCPAFAVWENVPGTFSSHKGEDFRAVLEELAKIECPWAAIPGPPGGKWRPAGCVVGDGWSIAWRVLDAQYWGVPQRRRRIALVLDLGGHRAPEILFERAGLPGNPSAGRWTWEASTGRFVPCAVVSDQAQPSGDGVGPGGLGKAHVFENHAQDSRITELDGVCCTVSARWGTGGNNQPLIAKAVDCRNLCVGDVSPTLQAKENGGQSLNYIGPVLQRITHALWIVRRITPTEAERLQGYPDGWTDIGPWRDSKGKLHKESSDSARYRAIGNSIALPQWAWLMDRMAQYLPAGATLGSLFDGIGGFPLVWERIHGKGTARWASEIEEFCIAVTKYHFGED
ncbi:MAG: hypothetical protein DBY27_03085 [Clostridiaceae bacterium]|nr:MAG: hypothetical protein DBY27_03085 [Clostridiaceae bacterium]